MPENPPVRERGRTRKGRLASKTSPSVDSMRTRSTSDWNEDVTSSGANAAKLDGDTSVPVHVYNAHMPTDPHDPFLEPDD
jgi:hypothetical protein